MLFRHSERFVFRTVGPSNVSPDAMQSLSECMEVVGAVPRTEIVQHYQWADVLVLPSISEWSANACYEALAAGLPVITTGNAGSVVGDEVDGFHRSHLLSG